MISTPAAAIIIIIIIIIIIKIIKIKRRCLHIAGEDDDLDVCRRDDLPQPAEVA